VSRILSKGNDSANIIEVRFSYAIRRLKVSKFETDSCHRQQSKLIERFNGISVIIPEVEIDVLSIIYVHDVEADRKAILAQLMVVFHQGLTAPFPITLSRGRLCNLLTRYA
jgi:hypothetical protein